ncbi:hypothetical protein AAEU31_12935 [Pseudoalteromonas sp. SSMSWG5]|uniref:hypothetical protein n=1 Tax=Pseudoalteromonas TaxID=53246 RepID=UPI000EBB3DBB|nr:hypothetical protein [Pseudoalteromonas sp. APAL1]MCF2922901.1 hypothetical protein [Pseudoalteromonas sp. APAL1]HCV04193.1 hypothetical protein [Pseudoalteromonas sp.]
MNFVITYLVAWLLLVALSYAGLEYFATHTFIKSIDLALRCALVAVIGGILYCLRSVYLNRCLHDQWSKSWEVWYYLRPITSFICGVVAYIFLKAGLVVLDASQNTADDSYGNYGYYAFAFFAGSNVDKFVAKIEEIGKSLFGIEKTRNSKLSDLKKENKE